MNCQFAQFDYGFRDEALPGKTQMLSDLFKKN